LHERRFQHADICLLLKKKSSRSPQADRQLRRSAENERKKVQLFLGRFKKYSLPSPPFSGVVTNETDI
jgi:hypothetical protein